MLKKFNMSLTTINEITSTVIPLASTAGFSLYCLGYIGTTSAMAVLPILIRGTLAALGISKMVHSAMLHWIDEQKGHSSHKSLRDQEVVSGGLCLVLSLAFLPSIAGLMPSIAFSCLGFSFNAMHDSCRAYRLLQEARNYTVGALDENGRLITQERKTAYIEDAQRCFLWSIGSALSWLILAMGSAVSPILAPFLPLLGVFLLSTSNLLRNIPTLFHTNRNNKSPSCMDIMEYRSINKSL